jgi:primase-polymerase (primpol)-like protein
VDPAFAALRGSGLHIFARGRLPPAGRRRSHVEMYEYEPDQIPRRNS